MKPGGRATAIRHAIAAGGYPIPLVPSSGIVGARVGLDGVPRQWQAPWSQFPYCSRQVGEETVSSLAGRIVA